jgi:hypothetical protein
MRSYSLIPICQIVHSFITTVVTSPLRNVPGPWIAEFSSKWLVLVDAAGRRAAYIHSLHQRYGPVMRIAPHELSFASAAAARDIYV